MKFLILIVTTVLLASCSTSSHKDPYAARSDVRQAIKNQSGEVQACYNQSLKSQPTLAGRLTYDFDVSDAGKIVKLNKNDARTTLHDKPLEDCVAGILQKIEFPAAPKGTVMFVSYPFSFNPQ